MKITEAAAEQILRSAQDTGALAMGLRVAAKRMNDGGIDYAMGFDEPKDSDSTYRRHGVQLLIAPTSADLLAQAILDYVQLDKPEKEFVFLNPQDPNFVPPRAED